MEIATRAGVRARILFQLGTAPNVACSYNLLHLTM